MEQIIHKEKITNHPDWNESYYFVFYDKSQQIGGMSRIGFKPNRKEGMTFFFLFFPDRSVAGFYRTIKLNEFTEHIGVKKMRHIWRENGTWDYSLKGNMIFVENSRDLPKVNENPKLIAKLEKVDLNLSYKPINKVYEYSKFMTPESLEIGKRSGDKHWEQIGVVAGSLKVGGDNIIINDVMSQRDHTYGVRDWTGVGNWIYCVIWFNKNLALNPAAIITNDGKISSGGFIYKNGVNIPLRQIKVLKEINESDGIFPINTEIEILDYYDETHNLKGKVGPIIPVPFKDESGNQSILVQSFGNFELDGIKGGYGTFETLRKLN